MGERILMKVIQELKTWKLKWLIMKFEAVVFEVMWAVMINCLPKGFS